MKLPLVKPQRCNQKGFTLIELLIIIAILAILALIAIPNIDNFRHLARVNAANSELAAVILANKAFAADHNNVYVASSDELTGYYRGELLGSYTFNISTGAIQDVLESPYDDVYWDADNKKFK